MCQLLPSWPRGRGNLHVPAQRVSEQRKRGPKGLTSYFAQDSLLFIVTDKVWNVEGRVGKTLDFGLFKR
jgi:hypothetical protein